MPTTSLIQLPRTRSSEEFEKICLDILSKKYEKTFSLYGKNGQKQNGIDMFCKYEEENYYVAQCKNYIGKNSSKNFIKVINKDINSSKNLKFKIGKFIVMTALDRDVNIQN